MNRLWVRLSLAFMLVAWIAVGAVALIVRSSIESSFRHYVNQRDGASFESAVIGRLEAYYAETGTWTGAEALLPGPRQGQGQGQGRGAGSAGSGGRQLMIADMAGVVQAAAELNQRPIALLATCHPDGPLPLAAGFIAVEPTNVVVSVL
jgi:hypothetical protein